MKRPGRSWILFVLPTLTVLMEAGKCGDESRNPLAEGEEFRADVTLTASGLAQNECIHLFSPGEDFPCCQVCYIAAGARRTVGGGMVVRRGSSYVFRAGRNGVILDDQSCTVSTGTATVLRVDWIGSGLVCEEGFD